MRVHNWDYSFLNGAGLSEDSPLVGKTIDPKGQPNRRLQNTTFWIAHQRVGRTEGTMVEPPPLWI